LPVDCWLKVANERALLIVDVHPIQPPDKEAFVDAILSTMDQKSGLAELV